MKVEGVKINGLYNPIGYLMEDIRCSWKVTESLAKRQKYARIDVALDPEFTKVIYVKEGKDLCQSGELLEVEQETYTRYYVRVTVETDFDETAASIPAYFETGRLSEDWKAVWITTEQNDRYHPVFYKAFKAEKEIASARLYISGLGLFEARLGGDKVGEEVLTPYYSNYHDEIQYLTYDITENVRTENKLEVLLGNGWYKGRFGLAGQKENFGNRFMLIAEIRLTYKDGMTEVIGTDESWEYVGSDVESSDIYDGEVINRLLWEDAGQAGKQAVAVQEGTHGKLIPRYSLPVMEMERLRVKEVIHTPAGETVLDFGQNFAGYAAFWSDMPKGSKVVLDFGEILQHGNFYRDNYRSAKSQFTYISDGRREYVKPRFTYFGFRYVRVSGWVGELKAEDFEGIAVYSRMKQTGSIETGHAGVNRLFSNVLWGQKSNSIDFPTDCPQRDERLGWTGDAQVFAGTASYNMDTAAFYHKFLHDLRTEQEKLDGILPGVIPVFDPKVVIFSSIWGDIATFLPMVLYEHFGDRAALLQYYPMMKSWVDKIIREDKARGQRHLFDFGNQLGDWLALDGRTPQSMKGGTDDYFIASCYYAASVRKTGEAAKILGFCEEERNYRRLYEHIYDAILREYYSESGRLCIDTQTGYIVALYFGIFKDKEKIIEGFKSRLYKDCYKLKGGFVGAPLMCRVMAENGLEEEAFYFLLQEGYPGWLHCVNLGATTVWERWNSVLDDGLLSGTMMNSLNHYSFGAVVEYLYRDVAGLKALEPGFKKTLITPLMNQRLGYMKMSYDSPYGIYRSEWEIRKDGMVHVLVEIPFDCSALIELPFYSGAAMEVPAGVYEYDYKPATDLRRLYTKKTLFKDMVQDEKVMEIIDRVSPLLQHFLGSGDEEFLHESLATLQGMSFLGFSEDEIGRLTEELTGLGMNHYYRAEKVSERITAIHSLTGEIMYLIEGSERAVLVDTCLGVGQLRSFAEGLTEKPITVLLTHGHIDHAMGAAEFEDVYMNPADRQVYMSQSHIESRKEYISMNLGGKLPEWLSDDDFIPAAEPDFKVLMDGDGFDLGGIHVEAYALAGHTAGSMVFLVREERILITGDACNNATFLFDENSLCVPIYQANLEALKKKLDGSFDTVLLCHHVMKAQPGIISEVIEVCEEIRRGEADDIPFEFMGHKAYIAKKCNERFEREDGKAGNIIYSKR